ncbi:ABC transporter ATP-binding protein [Bifidobacterium oedipodis]|uniref:Fatty acid ABC transporter ATP-binding/permease protein n=1 Tax=Bifidobacterium oedipodis TaxID=2675322 RepID=A0A7Y0ER18_9BIFI|nr:ABC transporter ATP-binding protein [Bifidobacterium sp. DSM 109957]NMM94779.1 ABC transporter [Bifidobacterium sp. DSM 109957]
MSQTNTEKLKNTENLENTENVENSEEEELEVPRDTKATIARLWGVAKEQHWRIFVVCASIVCYVAVTLAGPMYTAYLIDLLWEKIQAAFTRGETFRIGWFDGGLQIALLFVIYTVQWGFYSAQTFIMASFAERINLKLRNAASDKFTRLPLKYYDANQPGRIISRVTNDLDKMSEVMQTGLLRLLVAIGQVTGSVVIMLVINVWLALLFIVFAAGAMVVTRLVSSKTLVLAAERQRAVGVLTGHVEEAYSGRSIIRSFNQENTSAARIHQATQDVAEATLRADFMTNAINPAIRLIVRLSQVGIAVLAGFMLAAGQFTVGVFQAFFQYINQASEPLTEMSFTINSLQSALASVERVFDILDAEEIEPEPADDKALQVAQPIRGQVDFQHVRFGYDPAKPLMKDVTFTAEPGHRTAIVGATGAGKTTLINLLMRFYEIDGGHIRLDGVDTHRMNRADLRANFGMVLQDAWLFDGTIAENIAYGRPDATREEIIAAAKMARVDYFVRTLPDGYDTRLSNDAENISQGQRQLLTIARVILCDPKILILDEATSSVDTHTEQEIGKAMDTLMHGRTSFVIAHRLSTIVDADLILVMDHGTIIEQGTHRELLAADGAYAKLYNSQFA